MGGRVGNPRGLTAPGAGLGSARGRDSHREGHWPGVDTHCPGWGRLTSPQTTPYSLWLQRFAFLIRSASKTIHLFTRRAAIMFPDLDPVGRVYPIWNMMLAVSQAGANGEAHGLPFGAPFAPGPTCPGSTGRRPGVGTHPATGRPGVGPGSGLIWAPRGPGTTFTMSPRGFPTLPPTRASVMPTL